MTGIDRSRAAKPFTLTLAAAAACAALAACSSSSSSSAAASSSPAATAAASSAPASSAPASSAAASSPAAMTATETAIAANWTAFFNPKEPLAKRVALLEDGSALEPAVQALASSSTSAASSAKVVEVSVLSASAAKVTYDILLSGTPVLSNQSGSAVLEDGTWKVSTASFCGLLTLQGAKSLPSACKAS
jgi:hypothetical protein